jgi:small subunit ribosomal protein S2
MAQKIKLEEMIQSGMHFGHFTREWNPRMTPYIYGERNGRHIIDMNNDFLVISNYQS